MVLARKRAIIEREEPNPHGNVAKQRYHRLCVYEPGASKILLADPVNLLCVRFPLIMVTMSALVRGVFSSGAHLLCWIRRTKGWSSSTSESECVPLRNVGFSVYHETNRFLGFLVRLFVSATGPGPSVVDSRHIRSRVKGEARYLQSHPSRVSFSPNPFRDPRQSDS